MVLPSIMSMVLLPKRGVTFSFPRSTLIVRETEQKAGTLRAMILSESVLYLSLRTGSELIFSLNMGPLGAIMLLLIIAGLTVTPETAVKEVLSDIANNEALLIFSEVFCIWSGSKRVPQSVRFPP